MKILTVNHLESFEGILGMTLIQECPENATNAAEIFFNTLVQLQRHLNMLRPKKNKMCKICKTDDIYALLHKGSCLANCHTKKQY